VTSLWFAALSSMMETSMQPTMTPPPVSRTERQFAVASVLGNCGFFELTPGGHIERAVNQLAALLISLSRNNHYEGRDPASIPDNLASGFVAELLAVDMGILTDALIALQQRGFVKAEGHGLRLTSINALERLAG